VAVGSARMGRRELRLAAVVVAMLLVGACDPVSGSSAPGSQGSRNEESRSPSVSSPASAVEIHCGETGPASRDSTDRWMFTTKIDPVEGLAIEDVSFGPRLILDRISIPYVRIAAPDGAYGNLTPTPQPGAAIRSTLIGGRNGVECNPGGRLGVSATYELATPVGRYRVNQTYRFKNKHEKRCEPTDTIPCVRFWPTVSWVNLDSSDRRTAIGLEITQRFRANPDATEHGAADIIRDVPHLSSLGVDDLGTDGQLKNEGSIRAIWRGETVKWENWHQTGRNHVGLPGVTPGLIPEEWGGGTAGCSECFHMHWSWFANLPRISLARPKLRKLDPRNVFTLQGLNMLSCGKPKCWTDGRPQILGGSKQSACLGWVAATSPKLGAPIDWCREADANAASAPLDPAAAKVVFDWQASTKAGQYPKADVLLGGKKYSVGDSYWPDLERAEPKGSKHGGNGSSFIVPARRFITVSPVDGRSDAREAEVRPLYNLAWKQTLPLNSRVPSGWVLPIRIRLGYEQDQGPYYLRVKTLGARLLNPAKHHGAGIGGTPWVSIYADEISDDGTVSPVDDAAPPLARYPADRGYMLALVVLDKRPDLYNSSFELNAAPNGAKSYLRATGRWRDSLDLIEALPVSGTDSEFISSHYENRTLRVAMVDPRDADASGSIRPYRYLTASSSPKMPPLSGLSSRPGTVGAARCPIPQSGALRWLPHWLSAQPAATANYMLDYSGAPTRKSMRGRIRFDLYSLNPGAGKDVSSFFNAYPRGFCNFDDGTGRLKELYFADLLGGEDQTLVMNDLKEGAAHTYGWLASGDYLLYIRISAGVGKASESVSEHESALNWLAPMLAFKSLDSHLGTDFQGAAGVPR
jgi:hypothetical protein